MNNPLLQFNAHPDFAAVKPEHVLPAVEHCLAQCRATIKQMEASSQITWDTAMQPLLDAEELLSRAFAVVGHLNAVVNTPALREAHDAALPLLSAYHTEVAQNPKLYALAKELHATRLPELTSAQQRLLEHTLRDFRLGGADLDGSAKTRFAEIQTKLSQYSADFSNHVLDSMNRWQHLVSDVSELDGVPEDVLTSIKQDDGRYKLTLHAPCYLPVMQYAKSSKLRALLYQAYAQRASDLGPAAEDNSRIIEDTLALRQEMATMLGYRHYADVSLVSKMAPNSEHVVDFIRNMAGRAKPYAEQDLAALKAFAAKTLGLPELQVWDYAYVSEKLKNERYAYSELALKQYFTEDTVLAGMFSVLKRLYGVDLVARTTPTWHADVRFYEVREADGKLIGHLLMDLYARENKQNGAWVDTAINHRRKGQVQQTPLVYLTCNNARPVGNKPALLTHDEVITLFHEMGHAMHCLLCGEEQIGVTGFDGVEWDAVELPSQFMENFCYDWDSLQTMTKHVDTGETLPRDFFDKIIKAKNYQAGMGALRQMEFALFDMLVHSELNTQQPKLIEAVLEVSRAVRAEVAVVIPPAWHRFPHGFSHIFAGGYSAGYYSYKWAEVLSADAFAAFEEQPDATRQLGEKFRQEILARGGARSAADNFLAFRGRAPEIAALLRHNGMSD